MDGPDAEDNMSSGSGSSSSCTTTNNSITSPDRAGGIKCCSGCRTTKTPLWRGGPDGPKSLCNACGIRYRKRRRELLGIKEKPKPSKSASTPATAAAVPNNTTAAVTKKRKRTPKQGHRRLLLWLKRTQQHPTLVGEEEQAAFLLMALSCGLLCGA